MALVGFVAALGPIATFGITVTLEEVALLPIEDHKRARQILFASIFLARTPTLKLPSKEPLFRPAMQRECEKFPNQRTQRPEEG